MPKYLVTVVVRECYEVDATSRHEAQDKALDEAATLFPFCGISWNRYGNGDVDVESVEILEDDEDEGE
jgi:hypothetical protein